MSSDFIQSVGHYLAQLSPIVALCLIVAALLADDVGAATDIWRIVISIALGVFVTLAGMIYHNLESRVSRIEEKGIVRTEWQLALNSQQSQMDRIEEHLRAIDNRDTWKGTR